jgi:hypothetical protein
MSARSPGTIASAPGRRLRGPGMGEAAGASRSPQSSGAAGDPWRRRAGDPHAAERELQPRLGSSSKPAACSQTQRSACSVPQLWPAVARQPTTSSTRRRARRARRRCRRAPAPELRPRSGAGTGRPGAGAAAAARRRQRQLPRRHPAAGARLAAAKPASPRRSRSARHCSTRGLPGRTVCTRAPPTPPPAARWRVWRIQSAAGRPGSASRALRNRLVAAGHPPLCRPTHRVR